MNTLKPFQQKIGKVFRCWDKEEYDVALKITGEMLEEWPGNARACIFCGRTWFNSKKNQSIAWKRRSVH